MIKRNLNAEDGATPVTSWEHLLKGQNHITLQITKSSKLSLVCAIVWMLMLRRVLQIPRKNSEELLSVLRLDKKYGEMRLGCEHQVFKLQKGWIGGKSCICLGKFQYLFSTCLQMNHFTGMQEMFAFLSSKRCLRHAGLLSSPPSSHFASCDLTFLKFFGELRFVLAIIFKL